MKVLGFLSVVIVAGASALQGQVLKDAVSPRPVRVSTRLQLIMTVEPARVKLGQPVWVHAHYKNVTSKTFELGPTARNWPIAYWLIVTDASGTEIPRTPSGESWLRDQRAADTSTVGPIPIDPGEEGKEFIVDAVRYYDLTKPGTYFARLMFRSMWPEPGERWPTTDEEAQRTPMEESVSNLVQFTITP